MYIIMSLRVRKEMDKTWILNTIWNCLNNQEITRHKGNLTTSLNENQNVTISVDTNERSLRVLHYDLDLLTAAHLLTVHIICFVIQ
jgi:hypothetical protein